MCGHENESNPGHPETPDRIVRIWEALCGRGLVERCTRIEVGERKRGREREREGGREVKRKGGGENIVPCQT